MDQEGFVLHTIDYKDSSKILYLYTPNGHLSMRAYSVKKHNSVNRFLSQTGTKIKFKKSSKEFPILKDGELINDYPHIKEDLECFTFLTHINQLIRHTIDQTSDHAKMYHFVDKVYNLLNTGKDPEILSFIFELKLLYFLGYGLNFKECMVCGKSTNLVFHPSSGGVTCKTHLNPSNFTLLKTTYRQMQYLYLIDVDKHALPTITQKDRITIRQTIDILYSEFISFNTRARKILKQIKKY
ncbi:MAG: DNA repair protein RecO [Candidatus Izimaplasma sp.]|nr:DNA repair protein RecO [Candidatus Izimaplasma bacterium]